MYWAYYNASNLTTYYAESSSMTTAEFAEKVSKKIGKSLSASEIPMPRSQSDLKKMTSVNSEHIQ